MNALPQSPDGNCCLTACDEEVVVAVPGPKGDDGENGTDGADGINAFTTTTSSFVMPAEGATVVVNVANSAWIAIGQLLYVQNAGWMRATALPLSTQVTLRNEEVTATGVYAENVAPATVIAAGAKVSPGGLQGPQGTGSGDLISTNNLSDVTNVTTARSNLGLGNVNNTSDANKPVSTAQAAADTAATNAAIAASQPVDAFLTSIAALGTAADRMLYTTGVNAAAEAVITAAGRAILDDATAAAQRQTLSVLPRIGLLGNLTAVDLGVAGDTLIPIVGSTRYRVTHIIIENANASLATAMLGVFSAAGGIGTIAANQAVAGATAADKFVSLTISSIGLTDIFTGANLYFRVGTIQAAATVNVWVFGESFS